MITWKSALRVMGLAVAICWMQACQKAGQTTGENQPAPGSSNGAAAPGNPATPAAPVKPADITVPVGTVIKVRTTQTLSTKTLKTGDGFDAVLDEPLTADGKELFPKGAAVMGKVTESDPGGRVKGVASLAVELTMLHTADGQMILISTNPVSVQAKSTKTKDAEKVGVGAALGAAVGAIAGGGKGAGIGAAAGGGAGGAVVLATRGDAAEIPSESVVNFSLSSPLILSQ